MDNNCTGQNYLEILPNRQLIKCTENKSLQIAPSISSLLPVVLNNKEKSLIQIKNKCKDLNKHSIYTRLLKIAIIIAKILALIIKKSISFCAGVIGFIGVSVLIIVSTAIITKNIVNSYYGFSIQPDTTYSIFKMKEDKFIR